MKDYRLKDILRYPNKILARWFDEDELYFEIIKENNKLPSEDVLNKMSIKFNVSVDYILGKTNFKSRYI
jgi:hypothetical protein